MTPKALKALDQRWQKFLEDLTEPMGRSERRHWARVYVQGLLRDGERKSIEPMASRIEGSDVQALRQLVGQSPWPVEEVEPRWAHRDLASRQSASPTLSFRDAAGVGSPRRAGTGTPAARHRGAAGGRAGR